MIDRDLPFSGGSAIDIGAEGYAVVSEPVGTVMSRVRSAEERTHKARRMEADNDHQWIQFEVLADPSEETPRRPCWIRADQILCVTYLSPEHVEKIEEEI